MSLPAAIFLAALVGLIVYYNMKPKRPKTKAEQWMDIANGTDEATLEYNEIRRNESIRRANEGRPKFNGADKVMLVLLLLQIGLVVWFAMR